MILIKTQLQIKFKYYYINLQNKFSVVIIPRLIKEIEISYTIIPINQYYDFNHKDKSYSCWYQLSFIS